MLTRTYVFMVCLVIGTLGMSAMGVIGAVQAPPMPNTLGGMRREKGIAGAVFVLMANAIVAVGLSCAQRKHRAVLVAN